MAQNNFFSCFHSLIQIIFNDSISASDTASNYVKDGHE